jgi:hypothetical protein
MSHAHAILRLCGKVWGPRAPVVFIGFLKAKLVPRFPVVLRTGCALKEQGLAGSGKHFDCCQARIASAVTLMFLEEFTQPCAGLVQL